MTFKREIDRLKDQWTKSRTNEVEPPPNDPVEFCEKILEFKPTSYQQAFLKCSSKRIVLIWSRQSGKSHTLAARAIWFSLTRRRTLTLIVAPSLRQSMILSDKIQDFLARLKPEQRRNWVAKQQRTVIRFKNGSRIIALPCSEHLLRGYTADAVIPDEANFFPHDQDIFFSILMPMLATTDGQLIVSSTPWNKDSVFYSFSEDPQFTKFVVTSQDAVKAGLMKQEFIDQMRELLPEERFQREFESKFIEDIDAWLTQSLIVQCIDSNLTPYEFDETPTGSFTLGVDFGKQRDYSVIVAVEKLPNESLRIIHFHRFPRGTEYASVIGYVKSLCDRWQTVKRVYADITGVGNYIVEDMVQGGIPQVEGILFTLQSKEQMASILRETMRRHELAIPYTPPEFAGQIDLSSELNVEKYELMKTGHIRFSHPTGSHDDVFWALALAVYASRVPEPIHPSPIVDTGKVIKVD